MTLPRRSRAERRREGLIPAGEDPMLRRPPSSARPGPADPPAGRRRSDRPGPPPSPADVLTSANLSAPAPGRATPEAPRRPATTSAVPRAAVPPPGRRPAAGPVPARRSSDSPAGNVPRVVAPPRTTNLPYTPGPPTPAPESEQPAADDLDRFPTQSAPTAAPSAAAGAGRRSGSPSMAAAATSVASPAPRPGRAATAQAASEGDAPVEVPERGEAPECVPGPASGPVGGRAAARLERQKAEAAARKSGRRGSAATGAAARPGGPGDPTGPGRDAAPAGPAGRGTPRRAVQLVLATVVTALVVLGVWSFTSPRTEEISARSPTATSAPASSAAPASEPTPSAEAPPSESAPPAGPVRAPITVLNSTKIAGLAGDVGARFSAGGWQLNQPGAYSGSDVAVTTVFFAEGDPVQQEAANQLIAQFPDVTGGPAPRFFDIPGTPDPGLVVIVTGDWRP